MAAALLEYYKLGATSLLIWGYDPRRDAAQYGRELIPRLRQLLHTMPRRARPSGLKRLSQRMLYQTCAFSFGRKQECELVLNRRLERPDKGPLGLRSEP